MNILDLLKKLFPFLATAAEKTFDDLEDAAKEAGINGSLFAQIIKENTEAFEVDVENLIKAKLKLSDGQFALLMSVVSDKYGVSVSSLIPYLQAEFKNRTDDILHSSLANEIASLVAIVLSKGKLTWLTLLMGVGEFIYRKYVKGQDVSLRGDPTCPVGYYWDVTTRTCKKDIG